ncbi:phage antirepressor KilAC domain-containing protein [Rhizobium sp. X9]|uniref:phage antirepressor KilAC domain-containing protein n=1 Tax=Rhizobium sp. X9 TaxID=2815360 RepID=UPI001C0CFE87|nr:phage antirepressor KilAC domain-containing protein [Rhizobium sp. X9]
MNDPIIISGTEIRKIEYRGHQVVTFAMIDKVHGRPDGTAGRNFRDNRDRFVESEDIITLNQPDEIRRLGFTRPQGGTPASVILITKRGYLKIAKTLGDDKAWEVFDEMIERYFAAQQTVPAFTIPQTFADALRLAAKQSEQIEKQAAAITEMQPKAEFHDGVASAINAQDFQAVAKVFGTGRNRFMGWLRDRSFLMANNRPYQRYEDAGYFRVIERKRKDPQTGEDITYTKTLVTGKGVTYLHKKWQEDHPSSEGRAA